MRQAIGFAVLVLLTFASAHAQTSSEYSGSTTRGTESGWSSTDRRDFDSSVSGRGSSDDSPTFGALGEHGRVTAGNDEIGRSNDSRTAYNRQTFDGGQADVAASIRSDVRNDDTLSSAARDVSIVASGDNRVVLRGSVDNDLEKRRLVSIAQRHADQVVDQLTVK